jgi:hypothetical protein
MISLINSVHCHLTNILITNKLFTHFKSSGLYIPVIFEELLSHTFQLFNVS